MVIESWFTQDVNKPVKVQYLDGNLFSGNGNGNRIGVALTKDGQPFNIVGTVSGTAFLSDGTTVPCTGSRSGNKASVLIPAAAYLPGVSLVSIIVTNDTEVTTVFAVSTNVICSRSDIVIDPGSVITDWTNTINAAMQDVESAMEDVETAVSGFESEISNLETAVSGIESSITNIQTTLSGIAVGVSNISGSRYSVIVTKQS